MPGGLRTPPLVRAATALWLLSLAAGPLRSETVSDPRASASAAPKVSYDVRRALEQDGEARAFIQCLRADPPSTDIATRHAEHLRIESELLRRLGDLAPEVRYRYRSSAHLLVVIRRAAELEAIAADPGVASVELDLAGGGGLLESLAAIRADAAQELGSSGIGTVVAVLDSGVDTDHPDFEGRVLHEKRFIEQGLIIDDDAEDGHGHGTHVAGIIGSAGTVAPTGVAPEAGLVVVKVLDDGNRGWISDWTAGVEHVVELELAGDLRIDAINMSLVSHQQYLEVCDSSRYPFASACEDAAELGMSLFAASGNTTSSTRMSMPACLGSVISVGSVLDTSPDEISEFTSRNALLDLLAPGELITSSGVGGGTASMVGTSQASPHATGLALLLRERIPDLPPGEVLHLLRSTGATVVDTETAEVHRRVDAVAALNASQIPIVEGLTCSFEAETGDLRVAWDVTPTLGSVVVELWRDEDAIATDTVPISDGALRWPLESHAVEIPYRILARPLEGSVTGRASVCEIAISTAWYIRGDCNADGAVDIADPVRVLHRLFGGETSAEVPCLAACDSNDDGETDISDALALLNTLFLGAGPLPAPYPGCGLDPSPGAPECAVSSCRGDT